MGLSDSGKTGLANISRQKNGIVGEDQGCWWEYCIQEGSPSEARVILVVMSLHRNCLLV